MCNVEIEIFSQRILFVPNLGPETYKSDRYSTFKMLNCNAIT